MAGSALPIISMPLLPSLIPLDEEESLLFSHIKPLQGDALVKAAGISLSDLAETAPQPAKGKKHSNSWVIPTPAPAPDGESPRTQEPQFDTQSTSDTYEDLPFSQNLKKLVTAFPAMSEECSSTVLEKHGNDLPTALAWMQSITDVLHARRVLISAYPTAETQEVEDAVRAYKGDFMLAFNLLAHSHEPTEEWADLTFVRRRSVMDITNEAKEFVYEDLRIRSFENQWWRTCVMIRRHRISQSPAADALWPKLAPIAIAPRPMTHRFLEYVNNLGNYRANRTLFNKVVTTLKAQPEYEGIVSLLGAPTPYFKDNGELSPVVAILQVLVSDGLALPAAAAWLALCVHQDPDVYDTFIPLFYSYPATRRKMWNDRNVHLWACAETASAAGSANASRISATAAKETYASAVLGTIKHALEKQRTAWEKKKSKKEVAEDARREKMQKITEAKRNKKAKDSVSAESQGSKKSKRLMGLSPSADIPEEEMDEEEEEKAPSVIVIDD